MDDLVNELRKVVSGKLYYTNTPNSLRLRAADRIEADAARIAEAVKLLDERDREYNRLTNEMIERHAARIAELERDKFAMRDERDTAKIAAANYADFNHTWRARAEAAEARITELEAALRPFVEIAKDRVADAPEWQDSDSVTVILEIGDLRTALEGEK